MLVWGWLTEGPADRSHPTETRGCETESVKVLRDVPATTQEKQRSPQSECTRGRVSSNGGLGSRVWQRKNSETRTPAQGEVYLASKEKVH